MIILDYQDRRPLYEQIVEKFQILILSGALAPDTRLPSVRQLAMELSINPNTIQRAYGELEQQGLIYPVKGKGSFVSPNVDLVKRRKEKLKGEMSDLVQQGIKMGITCEECIHWIKTWYEEVKR